MPGTYVAYYRICTARQDRGGPGLEAQRRAVLDFLHGRRFKLVAEFTEMETGKAGAPDCRPRLREAVEACRRRRARLIIARLGRLARNPGFIAELVQARVRFVCADMPEANELTAPVLAATARHESRRVSGRIREALARAKARGVRLGNPGLARINQDRAAAADDFAAAMRPFLEDCAARGISMRAMVEALNRAGVKACRGGPWRLSQLARVLRRLGISTRAAKP